MSENKPTVGHFGGIKITEYVSLPPDDDPQNPKGPDDSGLTLKKLKEMKSILEKSQEEAHQSRIKNGF